MGETKQMDTKVIAGFPAVGKSYCTENAKVIALDSDSSSFSWDENGNRNAAFPEDYIQHIKQEIGKPEYIFVSTHSAVREALKDHDIHYILVYPSRDLKSEYIERIQKRDRGDSQRLVDFLDKNWDSLVDEMENETYPEKIKLQQGEFLSDIM